MNGLTSDQVMLLYVACWPHLLFTRNPSLVYCFVLCMCVCCSFTCRVFRSSQILSFLRIHAHPQMKKNVSSSHHHGGGGGGASVVCHKSRARGILYAASKADWG